MQVILANPRGFCAGVERAIAIVERAIEKFGAPIYVRHEVVHNKYVCDGLRAKGAVFVDELAEVPEGATVIFSAHGVAQSVREEASRRALHVLDATCPLVTRVHLQVARMDREGRQVIMIGHKGHPEVVGTMGQGNSGMLLVETADDVRKLAVRDENVLAYVTQTTLSVDDASAIVDELRARFPKIVGPRGDDICYATQNRQDAVKNLVRQVEVLLVVGSTSSSNSNRLREVAEKLGVAAYLISCADEINPDWLEQCTSVGVTAGASAPEVLVRGVVDRILESNGGSVFVAEGTSESVVFALPRELQLADVLKGSVARPSIEGWE